MDDEKCEETLVSSNVCGERSSTSSKAHKGDLRGDSFRPERSRKKKQGTNEPVMPRDSVENNEVLSDESGKKELKNWLPKQQSGSPAL